MDTPFPDKPSDLAGLLQYLQRVYDARGNMPLGVASHGFADGHLAGLSVHVGRIGAGKGPMKSVSRGGRDCLVLRSA
jgi:hypothetical protein